MIRISALIVKVFLGLALIGTNVPAEELSETKKAKIKQLLTATSDSNVAAYMASQVPKDLITALRSYNPNIDRRAFRIIEEEVSTLINTELEETETFYEHLYPVYHKHFSQAELEELIEFYQTPAGKKYNQIVPTVTRESIAAGEKWVESLTPQINMRLVARFEFEGIDLNPNAETN